MIVTASRVCCLQVTSFVQSGIAGARKAASVPSLPKEFLSDNAMIFLNIPMDAETPSMRLLRPQVRNVARRLQAIPPRPAKILIGAGVGARGGDSSLCHNNRVQNGPQQGQEQRPGSGKARLSLFCGRARCFFWNSSV